MSEMHKSYRMRNNYSVSTLIGGQYVQRHPDGNISVRMDNGGTAILNGDEVSLDLSVIRSVGIANLGEVESHAVNTIVGSRSHVIRFINGGILQFAYNNDGEIIELCAEKLQVRLSPNKDLVFSLLSSV